MFNDVNVFDVKGSYGEGDKIRIEGVVHYGYDGKLSISSVADTLVKKCAEKNCFNCKFFAIESLGHKEYYCTKNAPKENGFARTKPGNVCGEHVSREKGKELCKGQK